MARFVEGQAPAAIAQSLLEHIDACSQCRVLIASTLHASDTWPSSSVAGRGPLTFKAGAIVGARYRIVRFVSRGGMGEVYVAWDLELNESVALKTIACTSLDQSGLATRIRAEVQLARRVIHPNVCRILEFGVHRQRDRDREESIPFFTMELLRGETLAQYVARLGRLAESEAVSIADQILDGLASIHAVGIIHRDLKPENVFIELGAARPPRAVVMDFGLARLTDVDDEPNSSARGGPVGTPMYMAPEQVGGGTPSVAWDIYAFGVLLFRLVTGELPFQGSTTAPLAVAQVRAAAPPLSSRVASVHPALEAIVARCLERDPARRFATTDDLQRAFRAVHQSARGRRRWLRLLSVPIVCIGLGAWWWAQPGNQYFPDQTPPGHVEFPQIAFLAGRTPMASRLEASGSAKLPPPPKLEQPTRGKSRDAGHPAREGGTQTTETDSELVGSPGAPRSGYSPAHVPEPVAPRRSASPEGTDAGPGVANSQTTVTTGDDDLIVPSFVSQALPMPHSPAERVKP